MQELKRSFLKPFKSNIFRESSHTHTPSLFILLSFFPLTHKHIYTHVLTRTHIHTHTPLYHLFSSLSHTHTLSLSYTHIHTHSLSCTSTHTKWFFSVKNEIKAQRTNVQMFNHKGDQNFFNCRIQFEKKSKNENLFAKCFFPFSPLSSVCKSYFV